MMNLHCRTRHHEKGGCSKADHQESRVIQEPTFAQAVEKTLATLRRNAAKSVSETSEADQAEHVALDRSLPLCKIPLTNGDGKTVVAFAVTYRQWREFLEVMDWRLENGQAVCTWGNETIEMSALMRHPNLKEPTPCDQN